MIQFATQDLLHLLQNVRLHNGIVYFAIESIGIPFPGETMLMVAAVYAGTSHQLNIAMVIAAAIAGAILGDNLGYLIGREGGFRLLLRYGYLIHFSERKVKLAVYLFDRHGPKVVFWGRCVSVLRAWSAFLAGASQMRWVPFAVFNAAGSIVWATTYGLAGYFLGAQVHVLSGIGGKIIAGLAVVAIIALLLLFLRHERRLEELAEQAFPGPLDTAVKARSAKRGGSAER